MDPNATPEMIADALATMRLAQWYVISNDIGTVLAVYGSKLRDMAEAKMAALQEEFPFAAFRLHYILNEQRPRVGQSISMS